MTLNDMSDQVKTIIDSTSVGVMFASILEWLPAVAALFTIVWTVIRIYETKTVQRWLGK